MEYIGETHKSVFDRFKNHLYDYTNPKSNSHIRDHHSDHHQETEEIRSLFCIKVIARPPDALRRQVLEIVKITK